MRFLAFFAVLCTLLLGTTAWSYEGNLARGIVARQDDIMAAESATTGDAATTAETASATGTASNSAMSTESDATETSTGKSANTATKSDSSSTSVDPRMGAGGVSMITPTQGASSYYKIGDKVTFVWNYTSLAITPSAINVAASCSMNDATYTISNNMSVHETGKVVWDTDKYQANATVPLLTATYTLYVYDASKEMGDTASAGHLGSQNQFAFGMYVPKPYTPLNDYKCATCNSAMSDVDRNALKFAMGMVTITILSFTWFAGDFGVFAT